MFLLALKKRSDEPWSHLPTGLLLRIQLIISTYARTTIDNSVSFKSIAAFSQPYIRSSRLCARMTPIGPLMVKTMFGPCDTLEFMLH